MDEFYLMEFTALLLVIPSDCFCLLHELKSVAVYKSRINQDNMNRIEMHLVTVDYAISGALP